MKASKRDIVGALDRPSADIRFYLLYGPDESQSRGHAERLLAALKADKFTIAGSAVKGDPALLADEAGAMSLFGGRRAIWVEPAGEEIAAGIEALLESPPGESVVIAIAGALKKSSALLKRAEADRRALAFASWPLAGQDAEQMVIALGRSEGLRIDRGVAARLAEACGNDRGIAAQELAKLALFVGAAPESPKELGHDALDAVGADMAEGDLMRLADLALAGDHRQLADELSRLPAGSEAIPVIRALQRRLLTLVPLRARVERGERPDAVMASLGKSLFFKDEGLVGKLLRQWNADGLSTIASRVGRLERTIMSAAPPPPIEALGEELVAIARVAAARR